MIAETLERNTNLSEFKKVSLSELDFDVSSLNEESIRKELTDLGSKYINKYGKKGEKDDLGLVVGRFQPPHLGHLYQILAALEVADHVVIGLGSANADINKPNPGDKKSIKADLDNPLPPEEREFLFTHLIGKIGEARKENLLGRITFTYIDDLGNDEKWRNLVLDQVENLKGATPDVVVANDGWVKRIFNEFGVHTFSVPFLKTEQGKRHEGSKIRELLRKKGVFSKKGGPHRVIRSQG